MKSVLIIIATLVSAQFAMAHGIPASILNANKSVELGADYVGDTVGYQVTMFDSLVGVSTLQDLTRKIRVIRFKFAGANCSKDIEVYTKLDGSAVLTHKVVGCVP